jgi:molecular chaperone GrpE
VTHDPRTPAPPAEPAVPTAAAEAPEDRTAVPTAVDAAPEQDQSPSDDEAEPTPGDAVAGDAVPGEALPGDAVPGDAGPGDTVPESPDDGPHAELYAAALADPRSRVELFADLLEAEVKRDEYLDDLRRSHAELENYRKRVLRDAALQRDHGRVDVVSALLESLDDLDRTEQAGAESADEALAKGVALVATKLRDALGSIGVKRIDAVDVPFDPTVHEAVQQVPADEHHDVPEVAQVLRAGYRLGDRTLRAAMVVVRQ